MPDPIDLRIRIDVAPEAWGALKAVAEMVTEIVRGQSNEYKQAFWNSGIPLLDAIRDGMKELLKGTSK